MPKIIKPAKGTYTTADITVDSSGRVITASSGSGGAGMNLTLFAEGPSSGTFTAGPTATYIGTYISAGGGGGAQGGGPTPGRTGGEGGYGYFGASVTAPFSQPYAVGAGANVWANGGASTLATVATCTGGQSGENDDPTGGADGAAPGALCDLTTPNNARVISFGRSAPGLVVGQGGDAGPPNSTSSGGTAGRMIVFENTAS